MKRSLLIFGICLALVLGAHEAFAQASNQICFFGICIGGGGGGHRPTPAPLLAAGVPAFVALGGGVLFSKVYRRLRKRS